MNLLFVCTGNTCRSPMAEYLFRKLLKDAGRTDVTVASAGVSPMPSLGFPIEARDSLKTEGVFEVAHKAQGLTPALIKWADLVLTMESHHKELLVGRYPDAAEKTHEINPFTGNGGGGIRDPFGSSAAVYTTVLLDIKRALKKLLQKI